MTFLRRSAFVFLGIVALLSMFADVLAPAGYQQQFRELPNAEPSYRFLLGTDDLGRDRFSRLLYGTRVSLLLAPAAALLSTFVAVLVGVTAGYRGGRVESTALASTDLFASLPWLFLLFTVRAVLPLDVDPITSVSITFALLGALGWTSAARVIRAAVLQVKQSPFMLQARANGCPPAKLMFVHVVPALRTVVVAQFWLSVPLFLMAEANLGMLGLGVTEPMPSWGNLLAELQNYPAVVQSPFLLAPAGLLFLVLLSFHLVLSNEKAGI